MKKIIIEFLFVMLLSVSAFAQEQLSPDSVLRGAFEEDRINPGFKVPLHSSGDFVLSPQKGIIWYAKEPFEAKTIISPAGIGQEIDGQETMIVDAAKVPFIRKIYDLIGQVLAGKWDALDSEFHVKKTGTDKKWKIFLTPKNPDVENMPFQSIQVNGSRFADKVILKKKDKGTHILIFKNQILSSSGLSKDEAQSFEITKP